MAILETVVPVVVVCCARLFPCIVCAQALRREMHDPCFRTATYPAAICSRRTCAAATWKEANSRRW